MSLRIKFLGLLVVIPSLCLATFLFFTVQTFVDDKKTFLLEEHFNLLNAASLFLTGDNLSEFQSKLQVLLKQEGFESLLVVNTAGTVLAAADTQFLEKPVVGILGKETLEKLLAQTAVEGSFESRDVNNENRIVSFMKLSMGATSVVMLLHRTKSAAMRASTLFFLKAASIFVALLSFAVLVSLLFSGKLSKGILQLSQAMVAFGKGDAEAPLPKASDDEVGLMTRQFQAMRLQIGKLIESQKEKVKIETEMQLAGDIQQRFFPESFFQVKGSEFAGFYEPVKWMGGDWWFYFQKNNELIFLVGDVTGHGLNSAMITAVSRSVLSLIEDHFVSPGESLRLLNRAIYDASQGELCMTCVLGALNLDTGLLRYANASHEAPIVLPAREILKTKEFHYLIEVNGTRLGESKAATYEEASYQLKPDESVLFYTDGLTDLLAPNGERLGERILLKSLGQGHSANLSSVQLLEKLKTIAFQHRLAAELSDDLSFFFIKWRIPT